MVTTTGESGAVDAYLICATPRSGSTLLCGLLTSTGIAGRPESYFRQPDEPTWAGRWQLRPGADETFDYAHYVRAARTQGTTENGVFGARVMWGTMDHLVSGLRALPLDVDSRDVDPTDLEVLTTAFGRLRFVHLWRSDTVAQAVSWARAEQSQFWHPGEPVAAGREPRFDGDQIRHLVRTIDAHNAGWHDWFAALEVQPHRVRYEDLAADVDGTTREVLQFLGLRPDDGQTITARDRRQADELNADWIARYRAGSEPRS